MDRRNGLAQKALTAAQTHWGRTEAVGALAVTVLVFWAMGDGSEGTALDRLLGGNRAILYGTIAALAGSLLGFVLAAGAIIAPMLDSPRMKRVRESSQYPTMWRTFLSATRGLGLLTIAAIAALIVDRDGDRTGALTYAVLFLGSLATAQVATCIWILENVISVLTVPRQASSSTTGPGAGVSGAMPPQRAR